MIRLAVLAILLTAGRCFGQHSNGYLFAGPVGVANSIYTRWAGTLVHVGGGAEKSIGEHVTIGGEAGALFPRSELGRAAALFSINPAVYLRRGSPRLDPFVTGGVGVLTSGGASFLWNIGGGVNYWVGRHVGVRLELRDNVWPAEGINMHLVGVRFGIAFRGGS
ncbi:MAG TPA: hypothetical protein VFL57_11905 [Bryobacteraceae bacterium]|nr:hypothetical protein [Bryobacteraceae bacterium]